MRRLGGPGSGGGVEEREELLDDVAQDEVVLKERLVDLGETPEHDGVGHELVAHAHESADDEDAHLNRARAAEDGGDHDRAVLCEGPREVLAVSAAATGL